MNFFNFVCVWISNAFSEFACPDLKLEFHSALKFPSNHLHYVCDASHHQYFLDDLLDRGQRKIQSKIE